MKAFLSWVWLFINWAQKKNHSLSDFMMEACSLQRGKPIAFGKLVCMQWLFFTAFFCHPETFTVFSFFFFLSYIFIFSFNFCRFQRKIRKVMVSIQKYRFENFGRPTRFQKYRFLVISVPLKQNVFEIEIAGMLLEVFQTL